MKEPFFEPFCVMISPPLFSLPLSPLRARNITTIGTSSVIAWHLQEVAAGRIKRLIINLPPRHLKSICVSVAFTAWILGHNPTWKLLCASYSLALAKKLSYDCRLVMQSALYKQIFPQARIDPHKSTELEFALTKHGYRLACSLESGVTGRGGNMLILDDPMTPDQAYSASEREKVQERYQSTLYSRLNNKSTDAIILVMQRLHDEDLTGYLLDKDEWTHVDSRLYQLSLKRIGQDANFDVLPIVLSMSIVNPSPSWKESASTWGTTTSRPSFSSSRPTRACRSCRWINSRPMTRTRSRALSAWSKAGTPLPSQAR